MRHCLACHAAGLLLSFVALHTAAAYPVAPAIGLDELIGQADVVFKVEVLGTKPVEDDWFEKVHGFAPHATEMKVLAVYHGKCPLERIFLHHYASSGGLPGPGLMPQSYEFERGRSYIVFAKEGAGERVYRQIWKSHRSLEDQGVVLAANKEPHVGESVKEVIWRELTGLLTSKSEKDVLYAISHLNTHSGGNYEKLRDFDRREVLESFLPLLDHANQEVVTSAIAAIGSRNPYLSADYAPFWLASVGEGSVHGFGVWDRAMVNEGGQRHWKKLAAIADSRAPAATRSLAIKALGRAEVPQLLPHLERWAQDPEPPVRQSAIMLLADFPAKADQRLIRAAADDQQAIVRTGAAQAIGFGQFADQVGVLERLIDDKDLDVARMAAMSLLSFSLNANRTVLEKKIDHAEFSPLFVNALAAGDSAPYVDRLAAIIRQKREPKNWWGGRVPWGVSWDILFRYAQQQSPKKLAGGEMDKVLEALEYPASGDKEGPQFYSSSEPRDLYALYKQRGLTDRAQKFREACRKRLTYDIDFYFNMVDKNPDQYQRM